MILSVHMDLKYCKYNVFSNDSHSNMYWYVLVYHLEAFTIDIVKS